MSSQQEMQDNSTQMTQSNLPMLSTKQELSLLTIELTSKNLCRVTLT